MMFSFRKRQPPSYTGLAQSGVFTGPFDEGNTRQFAKPKNPNHHMSFSHVKSIFVLAVCALCLPVTRILSIDIKSKENGIAGKDAVVLAASLSSKSPDGDSNPPEKANAEAETEPETKVLSAIYERKKLPNDHWIHRVELPENSPFKTKDEDSAGGKGR